MIHGPRRRGSLLAEINIIPLVDITLVLLIVFMVAAPLLEQGLDVNLPEVSAGPMEHGEEDVVMTITKAGQVTMMDIKEPISLEELATKLPVIFEHRKSKAVYLRADQEVLYGTVAEVIALLQQSGAEKVGMVTVPKETPTKSQPKKTKSK